MSIDLLKEFLMWATVFNSVLLTFMAFLFMFAAEWVYKFHSRLFPMSREAFSVIIYCMLGGYKIAWILLNLVPYLALSMMA